MAGALFFYPRWTNSLLRLCTVAWPLMGDKKLSQRNCQQHDNS